MKNKVGLTTTSDYKGKFKVSEKHWLITLFLNVYNFRYFLLEGC